jgi:hypothetical protein
MHRRRFISWIFAIIHYAWDRSLVADELLKSFPDRNVWILGGPSQTGNGFQVLLGPVPARQLLGQSIAVP